MKELLQDSSDRESGSKRSRLLCRKKRSFRKSAQRNESSVLKWLWTVSGKAKWGIGALTLVQMLQGVFSVSYALFLASVINAAVAQDTAAFFLAIFRLVCLFAGSITLAALRRWLLESVTSRLENIFRKRLFSALLEQEYSLVQTVHSGEWINRMTSDTSLVASSLTSILPGASGMAVKLVGAVSMIIVLEPRFLYLIVPGGVLLILASTLFRKKMKKLHKRIQEYDGRFRSYVQDILGSMMVVRSYAAEQFVLETAEEKMESHRKLRLRRNLYSNVCNIGFGIAMQGASVLGAFFCGYGILSGTMSYGTFTAVLNLIGQIQAPFANISGFVPRYYSMSASAERLMEIESSSQAVSRKKRGLQEVLAFYNTDLESIELDHALFQYPQRGCEMQLSARTEGDQSSPSLQGNGLFSNPVTLSVRKGEIVAFQGISGCGKSTVLKLFMSLYPLSSGQRLIHLNNGGCIDLDGQWQRLFAFVPQGNHLMSGTIREIITFSDPLASFDEKRISQALEIACAQFVYELENGLDTRLAERGSGLSEGQIQRLAIARALFSRHPILLLDECTSSLDEKTEARLLKNLQSMTDRTVVIVTHRPAALSICSRVVQFTQSGLKEVRRPAAYSQTDSQSLKFNPCQPSQKSFQSPNLS